MATETEELAGAGPSARPSAGPSIEHFPVSFFASVMGLSGLALAWGKAAEVAGSATIAPSLLALFSAGVFVVLAGFYLAKVVKCPQAVYADFGHPIRLHFIPTISISMILLSAVGFREEAWIAFPMFVAGASLHLILTLAVLNSWLNRDCFEPVHLNPAWFIPIVGNVVVPIAGVPQGYVEISWFFFSIGIVFWLVLFAIITNRVLFHHPLPENLAPTLFILVAPPAAAFLSYMKLTGEVDVLARILFYFALFMTLFLMTQVPRLVRLKFSLSWWAYSFPLAAITAASWTMYEQLGGSGFEILSVVLLVIATGVVGGLVVRTGLAVRQGQIGLPE